MHVSIPRDGIPPLLDNESALYDAAEKLQHGEGLIAVDTERAADYRYDDRAYLVQLRRPGCGTLLVDPTVSDAANAALGEVLNHSEWILHAAHTDLPYLAAIGWHPTRLHDTQITGRLLGLGQPGLSHMLEHFCGISIDKDKGHEDWSARPLSESLLAYAALDVEHLGELLAITLDQIDERGRRQWYVQECSSVLDRSMALPTPAWTDMKGLSALRNARSLAIARALWTVRDDYASTHDLSPHRIIKRKDILRIAQSPHQALDELHGLVMPATVQRRADTAVKEALHLPQCALPRLPRHPGARIPAYTRWETDHPRAFMALEVLVNRTHTLAEELDLTVDTLATMKTLRTVAWATSQIKVDYHQDPVAIFEGTVGSAMESHGARPWQIDLIANTSIAALIDRLY